MEVIQGQREALLAPLATVSGIIDTHQTHPILGHVLVQTEGTKVTFTGSDLEIQIRTSANNEIDAGSTQFTVSAKKALDLFKVLPNTSVTLSLGEAQQSAVAGGASRISQKLEVSAGRSHFSLQTLPASDYPKFPAAEFTQSVHVTAGRLKYLLGMVHYAMAVQDVRFYLNGMRLVVKGEKISAVATDGRRLALCEQELAAAAEGGDFAVTVPRKTVAELRRLLPDDDTDVKIETAASQIRISFAAVEITSKLLEGAYPDYARVIPKNNDKEFLVDRETLLSAVHRTAVLASAKFMGVRWLLNPGLLSIQCTNTEQEEGTDEIAVDYQNDPIDIGFNINFLSDVLNNLKTEKVRVSLAGSQGSALITMPDNASFRYVLMPMRL